MEDERIYIPDRECCGKCYMYDECPHEPKWCCSYCPWFWECIMDEEGEE